MTSQFEIWIDGRKIETERALVSVLDRGFLYGDSVFETLRTYGGKPFALDEHLQRLAQSAAQVFITLPLSRTSLRNHLLQAIAQSSFSECYVRVMVTRGQSTLGLDPRGAVEPLLVLILAPLVAPPAEDYQQGISAVTFECARPADRTSASGAKVGNYLVAILGQKKATDAGAKEALIMTSEGEVLEGATSNLFWLDHGVLKTVPVEAGILAGITRAHILAAAHRLSWPTQECVPKLADLLSADAVFISSSIREILSVIRIDDRLIGSGDVHPAVKTLHEAFRSAAMETVTGGQQVD